LVRFRITQPDGKVYAEMPIQEAWVGKPAPAKLGMSVGYIKLRIEPDELLGEYEINATVIDKNSKDTLELSSVFLATEK